MNTSLRGQVGNCNRNRDHRLTRDGADVRVRAEAEAEARFRHAAVFDAEEYVRLRSNERRRSQDRRGHAGPSELPDRAGDSGSGHPPAHQNVQSDYSFARLPLVLRRTA